MDIIYMFAGERGARAYSSDEDGANLPAEYAPWRFRKAVKTDGPTFQAGIDKEALIEVKANGFAISVWSAKFD